MTINSFTLRPMFKRTNNDPVRRDRRNPHRWVWRDPKARADAGEFKLAGDWNIACMALDPGTAECLRTDVADFFGLMQVTVRSGAERGIEFRLADDLAERDCRYSFEPDRLVIEGGGQAGLWAGLAWMEQEMRARRGPFLPKGRWERRAQWQIQMSSSVWGANYSVPDLDPEYLGDDSFRLYAHYGVNVMMLHGDLLCYVKSAVLPELSHPDYERHIAVLKQTAARALRYGVRLNLHVESPKLKADHPLFQKYPEVRGSGFEAAHDGPVHVLCSLQEKTLAFYEETFGRLFREVPELAGVTLIPYSESFFHCRMWTKPEYPCPRCFAVPPEDSVAVLVNRIARSIKQAQPRAYTAVWIYSPDMDRLPFVKKFSPEVTILQHVEKGAHYKKDGYTKHVWDYSIDCLGPSSQTVQLAEFAHQTGRQIFIKTETAIGLEVCQFPYVPAMQRLAEKWEIVKSLKPNGVHQAWFFFGMFGSRAEELGFWAAYGKEISQENFLRRLIVRDFGAAAAASVMEAWEHMSRAMGYIPCTCLPSYYQGPGFLGPAHPLIPVKGMTIPELFTGYRPRYAEATFHTGEDSASMVMHSLPDYSLVVPDNPSEDAWDIVVREYHRAAEESALALAGLREAQKKVTQSMDNRQLHEEILLVELIWRTMMACENSVRFLKARRDYEKNGNKKYLALMKTVARAEKENASAAVPIYREARWLDVCERTDHRVPHSSLEMIDQKIGWIDEFLKNDPSVP